ncbi:MAG: KTSC domain-containing protein [Verrucomicrobiota bacterium]|nr:KTSC domain-containing protein [Verrucomicrobiota bacterium]
MRARWAGFFFATMLCLAEIQAADRSVEPIVSRIKRAPVESTALDSIGYSRKLHALEIEFHDGLIYRYEQVPPQVYRELTSSESKARFYNKNIRGKFHCVRVKARRKR